MQRRKFTQEFVRLFKAPAQKLDFCIWDRDMPGFGIRFRSGGVGHYVIHYKVNGKQGKMSLGHINKITLRAARTEARNRFAAILAMKIHPALKEKK